MSLRKRQMTPEEQAERKREYARRAYQKKKAKSLNENGLLDENGNIKNPWIESNPDKWNDYQASYKREKYANMTPEEKKEFNRKQNLNQKKRDGLKKIEAVINEINEANAKSKYPVQFKLFKPGKGRKSGPITIEVEYKK
jgi:hypothetical protein